MRRRQPHWFALTFVRRIIIFHGTFPDPRQFLGRPRLPGVAAANTISDCSEGSIMPKCTPTKIKIVP
jgi:hypothetical protein